jgi:iron complex outermembrane receptor protein
MFNPEGSSQTVVRYAFTYSNVSGTLGFNKQLNERFELGITLANAWRAPQASELFSAGLHHGAARVELGDKTLSPERSYNLNFETKYQWKKLSAQVSLYSQFINDFIYLQPGADVLTIRGFFKTFRYTQTNAWLSGADLSARYQLTNHIEIQAKSSLLRARDYTKRDWLILMPADQLSLQTKYSFQINERWKDCYIGLEGKHVFKQSRIPQGFDSIDYPRPPAAYFLLNADMGTKLVIKQQPLYISLTVMNILNQRYRDYLDVFRYFIDRPGRNIVLRVRVPFSF